MSDAVVAAASRPEGVVATDTPRSEHTDDAESIERLQSAVSVPTSGCNTRTRTRGQVQWGALAKRPVQWGALTNRPALRSPPRTEALPPNENLGEQPDKSELSAQEGSSDKSHEPPYPVEEEHELDVSEAAQRTLGEQRIMMHHVHQARKVQCV